MLKHINQGNEAPKYVIGERRKDIQEEKERFTKPGPCDYSPQKIQKKAPSFSLIYLYM